MAGPYSAADEKKLMARIWDPEIADNPYNFVMFTFPWGKAGTPLANFKGPKTWQIDDFLAIAEHIKQNRYRISKGIEPKVYMQATVSGRGPGKSAELAMLTYWMMSVNIGSSTIITANNETQLKTRTMAEVGKWHTMAINSHWFDRQAMALKPAPWFEQAVKNQLKIDTGHYYAQAQLWSEENPDGFAGVHNQHGVMVEFDEASGVPSPIWTVTEGFFARPVLHRYWLAASNGRRNTGAFFECFHKDRARWRRNQIDARKVEGAALEVLNGIISKYGEDSDEARTEVLGQFPKKGDKQFIPRDYAEDARTRLLPIPPDLHAPLIMGVDIARFGDDKSVIRWRQGRDARSIKAQEYRGLDNVQMADVVSSWIDRTKPDAVNIDGGNGSGVIDILKHRGYKVNEILFGSKPNDPKWYNKRTEIWADMRDWLPTGCIDDNQELVDDLVNPEYEYPGNGDRQSLETKDHMKDRGIASPDAGDALALTFAVRVNRKDQATSRGRRGARLAPGTDYGIFSR
jgi:hypothetical protein